MNLIHKCTNCIWFDKCAVDEYTEGGRRESNACDSYEPASFEEQEEMDVAEYEEDLRMRHDLYGELIAEQDD